MRNLESLQLRAHPRTVRSSRGPLIQGRMREAFSTNAPATRPRRRAMRAMDAGSGAACAGPHSCHTPPSGLPRRARSESCSKSKSRINPRKRPCGTLLKLAVPAQISAAPIGGGGGGGLRPRYPAAWPRRSPKPAIRAKVTKLHDPSTPFNCARLAGPWIPVPRAASVSPRARPGRGRGGPRGGPRTCGRRQRASRPCPACWSSSPPRSRSPLRASVVGAVRL